MTSGKDTMGWVLLLIASTALLFYKKIQISSYIFKTAGFKLFVIVEATPINETNLTCSSFTSNQF